MKSLFSLKYHTLYSDRFNISARILIRAGETCVFDREFLGVVHLYLFGRVIVSMVCYWGLLRNGLNIIALFYI